ncbi:MAG TPA: peptidyl-prolyl cis-trans isomerase [Chromatiaceae bacterium]|nr:peptidyl-prolyl cis-trans isomerase [Chromatiaceae bacterium]
MKTIKTIAALLLLAAACVAQAGEVKVLMKTSKGDMEIALDADKAPKTVENFLRYVDDGFYNGTIFHRVISGFMIQGGGYTPDMRKKETREAVPNEAKNGLKNKRGTIAMARTSDPHSATAQFFINHKDNANLDHPSFDGWGYAVFGRVTKGLEVLDAIAAVPTGVRNRMRDVPLETVVIESVQRIEESK